MNERLQGQIALVTGASAGIGRACALALAAEGAEIIATARTQAALQDVVRNIENSGGKARYVAGDLNDNAFLDRLGREAGAVDILVNNAGILTYAPFIDTSLDDIELMVRTNLLAPLRLTHWIAGAMAKRGCGHVIMISSGAARRPVPLGLVYTATKHAIAGMTRVLRMELQDSGLKVTEIAPGSVETGIRDTSTHPQYVAKMQGRSYQLLAPEDVASAVVYAATLPEHCTTHLIEVKPRFGPSS